MWEWGRGEARHTRYTGQKGVSACGKSSRPLRTRPDGITTLSACPLGDKFHSTRPRHEQKKGRALN